MNLTTIKKIQTPEEIIQQFPLSEKALQNINKDRQEVKDILSGKDDRILLIIGPCSAWPYDAVIEYANRLKKLSDKVENKIKLVLRTYIQKPRTTKGWTGPVNQPNPFGEPDIEEGIKYTRSLMVKVLEMGLPIADEALFTHNAKGFLELLSWVAIGARSVEDQEHRIFASAVDCPVGMKNPTSGNIKIGVNSIIAAQNKHVAVFNGFQVETGGNNFAHLVLRGGADGGPNYHTEDLFLAKKLMEENSVKNPAVVIDASHDNALLNGKKDFTQQVNVIKEVMDNIKEHEELRGLVKGFMVESFIKDGNQSTKGLDAGTVDREGLSITDPCLGWEKTEKLVLDLAGRL